MGPGQAWMDATHTGRVDSFGAACTYVLVKESLVLPQSSHSVSPKKDGMHVYGTNNISLSVKSATLERHPQDAYQSPQPRF